MAHLNRVLRSINNDDASRCVDIFVRPEGTIGFEEYRRDVEDGLGWFPVSDNSSRTFDDESSALRAATAEVAWLRQIIGSE
jgi:hypothetical protein